MSKLLSDLTVIAITVTGIMAYVGFFALLIAGAVGYILNIIKIAGLMGSSIDVVIVELAVRIIGVPLPPVGAIAGWF